MDRTPTFPLRISDFGCPTVSSMAVQAWGPALAAVNSFGFGGTNPILSYGERVGDDVGQSVVSNDGRGQAYLLSLSASGEAALRALSQAHLDTMVHQGRGVCSPIVTFATRPADPVTIRIALPWLSIPYSGNLGKTTPSLRGWDDAPGDALGLATVAWSAGLVFCLHGDGASVVGDGPRAVFRDGPSFGRRSSESTAFSRPTPVGRCSTSSRPPSRIRHSSDGSAQPINSRSRPA